MQDKIKKFFGRAMTFFMIIWLLKTYKWKMALLLIIGGLCIFGWLWIKMKFNKRETMEVDDVQE